MATVATKPNVAALVRVADRAGLSVRHAVRFADLLAEAGLVEADVTEELLAAAEATERAWEAELRNKVIGMGGIWNNRAAITKAVAEVLERHEEAKATAAKDRAPSNASGRAQVKVFGHSATAVLRWMGKTGGWSVDDAATALLTMGCRLSDTTVRIQLKAGRDGERGDPAPITKEQAKKLREAAK